MYEIRAMDPRLPPTPPSPSSSPPPLVPSSLSGLSSSLSFPSHAPAAAVTTTTTGRNPFRLRRAIASRAEWAEALASPFRGALDALVFLDLTHLDLFHVKEAGVLPDVRHVRIGRALDAIEVVALAQVLANLPSLERLTWEGNGLDEMEHCAGAWRPHTPYLT
jgi:hypothetical protein